MKMPEIQKSTYWKYGWKLAVLGLIVLFTAPVFPASTIPLFLVSAIALWLLRRTIKMALFMAVFGYCAALALKNNPHHPVHPAAVHQVHHAAPAHYHQKEV